MLEFLFTALAAGIGIALVTGPLGAFVVWRKMAYFGDTLAHASLLGIAGGVLLSINTTAAVIVTCMIIAIILVSLQQQKHIASDTLLGILSHSTLACGLIAISLLPDININLMGFLFGDLLAVTNADLYLIYTGVGIVFGLLAFLWKPLLAITVNEELAKIDGRPVTAIRLSLMFMLATVIAIAMKVVGILLITALLIIPAATARRFSKSPHQMAILASALGCLAVIGGVFSSFEFDTPTGPSVVLTSALLFLMSMSIPARQ